MFTGGHKQPVPTLAAQDLAFESPEIGGVFNKFAINISTDDVVKTMTRN